MAAHSQYVTINSLTLDVAGFCYVRDLSPLLQAGPLRGTDFVEQGVDGRTYRAKAQDELRVLLPLVIFSDNTSSGTPHTNSFVGLRKNVAEIQTACVTGSKSALVTLTLNYGDASTRTGSVWCPRLDVALLDGYRGKVASGVLEVVVPSGALTA